MTIVASRVLANNEISHLSLISHPLGAVFIVGIILIWEFLSPHITLLGVNWKFSFAHCKLPSSRPATHSLSCEARKAPPKLFNFPDRALIVSCCDCIIISDGPESKSSLETTWELSTIYLCLRAPFHVRLEFPVDVFTAFVAESVSSSVKRVTCCRI